ncbi:MAG: radical SAM family heme chaperone HemW [Actinomycetota bacterium]|nr:radical SAM family heme chaperone HemW [Actinomycetota bacterium]
MPSTLPVGDPAPADGRLSKAALDGLGDQPFGIYVHVPFCTVRCGYCDFNTYTADELGPPEQHGASRSTYADAAIAELRLASDVLAGAGRPLPQAQTVFFGGGTPTVLDADDLVRMLQAVDQLFGLAPDVEVTTEANPDSVSPDSLARLQTGGFTRISYGMQSAVPHVLATLDRTHHPDRVPDAVTWARDAGFEQVSLDLIHGTPGESLADWRLSVETALAMEPNHISAYALIVEPGTALARRVARGEVPEPDDDRAADCYELADDLLGAAGYEWYELSNWAAESQARCRHNLTYWLSGDWWGIGPGAHSHVQGVRWWNVKHPAAYAARVGDQLSPAHAREVLDAGTRRVERVLLETRLASGLDPQVLDGEGRDQVPALVAGGLVEPPAGAEGRLVLTRRGRLLADEVVRRLVR